MPKQVLQGTLDLMVLRTLEAMGPQHGFGLANRILQVSEGMLDLKQGTLYPALLRLQQRGWIKSRVAVSDNNRKAKPGGPHELGVTGFGMAAHLHSR
jgi:PadR family transcriptional regulator, regulatory protein PadR